MFHKHNPLSKSSEVKAVIHDYTLQNISFDILTLTVDRYLFNYLIYDF